MPVTYCLHCLLPIAYCLLPICEGGGKGEGDIDVIDTTCNKQDYLIYIAY